MSGRAWRAAAQTIERTFSFLRLDLHEHMFDSWNVDRRHELENLRRSLAMLTPGTKAITREEALLLFQELGDVRTRLNRLRQTLRQLAEEDEV